MTVKTELLSQKEEFVALGGVGGANSHLFWSF